jgi:transcriptional regulator GlxA family with amidase domain
LNGDRIVTKTIGIVLYPDFEELDAVGPYEAFGALRMASGQEWQVVTIARTPGKVRGFNGLEVEATYGFDDAPTLDVILLPGGLGSRDAMKDPATLDFVRRSGDTCQYVTSVCTGALILHAAGFLKGRRATTYWGTIDLLRSLGDVEVVDDERYVHDGNVITSAGVSAGIDMSLYLVSLLKDANTAKAVQKMMEYYPKPPEFAEAPV